MNLANYITVSRLVLAVVFFLLLGYINSTGDPGAVYGEPVIHWMAHLSVGIFIVSLLSDSLDGYVARMMDHTSAFGRYIDPLADKILICGALIMFLGSPIDTADRILKEWMVVIVVGREFMVQGIRTNMEQKGIAFPALAWGKIKMVIQSICAVVLMLHIFYFPELFWFQMLTVSLVWLMVISTICSGVVYVYHSVRLLKQVERG